MEENRTITLAIDSSSSISGLALFVDNELKEYTEIIHNESKKSDHNYIDLNQARMQDVIDKLLFKYLYNQNVKLNIVIEIPRGSYTNNKTYGRLMFYAGLWLGKITALLAAMPNVLNNTRYITLFGGIIAKKFNFEKELIKQQSINKVKELYSINLNDYKIPRYNQDGSIKRRKKTDDIVYDISPKHNAADAILLGHLVINKLV